MSEVMSRWGNAASFAFTVIRPLWWIAKTALVAVLGLVAPILAFIFGTAAVLLALTAVIFRYGAPQLDFPLWEILGLALICAVARVVVVRSAQRLVRD